MGKKTRLTSGSGKHSAGRRVSDTRDTRPAKAARPTARPKPSANNLWERLSPAKRALIVLASVILLAAVLILLLWSCIGSSIKPPDITDVPNKGDVTAAPPGVSVDPNDPNGSHHGGTSVAGRKDGFYTILLMGQNQGLTDVIMVAGFDTVNHTIEVVSIPRDTYSSNLPYPYKINAAYRDGGVEGLYEAVEGLIGFKPDKYMLIDYDGFVELVDTIGGVEFDVPARMYHIGDNGKVDIDLQKGYQHLNGKQALGLVRTRSVYADQDLGRIRTAQKFLVAAAQKAVSTISFDKIDDYADIVVDYVKTDLTAGELIWFMQQAMKVDMENDLNMHAPAALKELDAPTIKGSSLVCLRADTWLQLINSTVNPYTRYITFDDVDIVNPSYTPTGSYVPEGEEDEASKPAQGTTTIEATAKPDAKPTAKPAAKPASTPKPSTSTPKPTSTPRSDPTPKPTVAPDDPDETEQPTAEPTDEPTVVIVSDEPTAEPTDEPTVAVTDEPTAEPSEEPFVPATHE